MTSNEIQKPGKARRLERMHRTAKVEERRRYRARRSGRGMIVAAAALAAMAVPAAAAVPGGVKVHKPTPTVSSACVITAKVGATKTSSAFTVSWTASLYRARTGSGEGALVSTTTGFLTPSARRQIKPIRYAGRLRTGRYSWFTVTRVSIVDRRGRVVFEGQGGSLALVTRCGGR